MIVCGIVYVILLFLVITYQKGMFTKWGKGKTGKQILVICFLSNTIALSLFWIDCKEGRNHKEIRRNSYDEGMRRDTYEVTIGDVLKAKEISIDVEEQKYTAQEIQEIFRQIMEEMDEVILGENKSLDRVEKDMNLLAEWGKYPVGIQWELDRYDVMNVYGEIQQEKTKPEGTLVKIKGILTYEGEEALYEVNAMVYPETKNKEEKLLESVRQKIEEEEKNTRTKENFLLPESVGGEQIIWKKKVESRGYYVLILGGICAVLMVALKKQNEQKIEKERQEQMITDYPEMIYKFVLLLSTGMTIKSVWERIVRNYEEQKTVIGKRAVYEEMRYTCREMQSGITEAQAYERFGKRCGISIYIKFGALLAQNMKKGTKGIMELLQSESIQAFEKRKNRAKRLGEEASTKLLVPMFGMLMIVLVIVIVPAFLSIQL